MMNPIFTRNQDIDKIAFVNWRINPESEIMNLRNIGDGYLKAAIKLTKLCLINNNDKSADILIFPILNNANHGIEVYLKALIWTMNSIAGSPDRTEKGHNIRQLYRSLRAKTIAYYGKGQAKDFDLVTKNVNDWITELFEKIGATDQADKMDFSRYPFNHKYEEHFYVTQFGSVEIDLENFVQRFEGIHNDFENLSDYLYYNELMKDD